jgi:putative hemolysin
VLTISLVLILLLILANGLFAMSEIAVVTARKSRLRVSAAEGDPKARRVLELAESPSRFLATVQIGITLVGVFTGAFSAATIAQPLAELLRQVPALRPYALPLAVGVVVVGVTYVSLLLGELVPKRIALHSPERIAGLVAPLMHGLAIVARPAVWLMSVSTEAVVRLLGIGPRREPTVTEEEIAALLAEGTRAGVFRQAELEVVERVFWLADETAETVMTPRNRIVWLDVDDPVEETIRTTIRHPHTRYLVCEGELDHVLGVVDVRDLWADLAAGEPLDIRRRLRKPLFLPESMLVLNLLERFRSTGIHLAILLDEYGGITGIVTPSDILEGIVGQIEPGPPRITMREDGSLLVDAALPMDELRRFLGVEEERFAMPEGYRTVGGFILQRFGRVPMPGERFVDGGYCFEVVDLDGFRIDKVLVRPEQGEGERRAHEE